ncbi:hypothetical protein I3843_01G189900 [Carya illinoinensis]|uniref:NAB domain-containing protein n=1 Tax=Carya illinoinensis TaxID=32201 RepID=A0A8T1RN44_CARIL|nr:protein NETWORKED 1A-like [Carya illinoinensis]XP_042944445.1 protein NETWORKED 1A-like [Carya illinoinensis]XP_042944450.1 protein NETWORKED 1A-like [Carya illinoinensis]KAG6668800.1 hypothetical protein CIPAW_01G197200 [Carya illinoinensis]KAG7997006.1 hypothetical protein I3843_01G189900 [Carya illinoinensis]KAG7997007.1 hypothetical protein I3843_01G189900 [Carya illinoinensis]KAG7997008.1 hypothetical protein I3843_01G189900 [Carya illinoinensis]
MATLSHSDSRRLYSWWWDSHISPKNSKWLQENLTDMDAKVKAMIKLIEEDADSFARRAEMYYKKRPELMKLVEEFYRAYRALAERYDHATVELRQAHRTMAEAFPSQVPYELADNSPSGSSGPGAEPHTPEMPHPIRALVDPDDLCKDALGVSSTSLHATKRGGGNSECESAISKRGLKQFTELFVSREAVLQNSDVAEGRMKKGMNVYDAKENEQYLLDGFSQMSCENQKLKSQFLSESQRAGKAENDVQELKKALAEIQCEKEAVHLRYKQSLENLSHLERELDHAQKDAAGLDEQVRKAETEIKILKEVLTKLEAERDAGLLQFNQCLERISSLENLLSVAHEEAKELNEKAIKAENGHQHLKSELSRLEAEKESALLQNRQCLEKISVLETKISLAEVNARFLNEQIERAETEVKALKKAFTELNEEKEAAALQYKQCLEKLAKMESELFQAQEDAKQLYSEILRGAAKLKSAEEQCLMLESSNQSLKLEANNLVQKIAVKDHELSEKHYELEKLQTLMQEECSRFEQIESSLQALQKLHYQSQEEQRGLTLELKNGLQMLKDLGICKHGMEEQLQRVEEENRSLNEVKFSSAISINNLQNEVFNLKAMKEKLEVDVALKTDQSDTLQQEIYHLKEEIKGLNGRYRAIMEQVESVGLSPGCIESYVKDLQVENSNLKEVCKKGRDEKEAINEKLKHMDNLSIENVALENSLSRLNGELEGMRENAKNLQQSCQFLHEDKATLVAEKAALLSQLQIITENMQKLMDKNTLLENSLSCANLELEGLRAKSKSLEELCQLLSNEKSNLLSERCSLVSHLENVEQRLGNLEKRFTKLEEKYSDLEKEKEFTLSQVVELQGSLFIEKQERTSFVQSSQARLAGLENQVHIMQQESRLGKKGFEEELDRAVVAQVEIFILQRFIEDLEEKNLSLAIECQKQVETSKFSDKLITELECENLEQQVEAEFLLDEIQKLRMVIHKVFRAIQIDPHRGHVDKIVQEHIPVLDIFDGIEDLKSSLLKIWDEKQQLLVENSVLLTLLGQLRLEGAELESEKKFIAHEFEFMTEQCAMLQKNKQELQEMNRNLQLEMEESDQWEDALNVELEALHVKLINLEGAYLALQEENSLLLEEKKSLLRKFSDLNEEKCILEEENSVILHETLALSNLSVVFESFASEKSVEIEELADNISSLHLVNGDLKEEVGMLGKKMEMKESEIQHLNESVEKLGRELNEAKDLNDQLCNQISIGEDFLRQTATELSEAEQILKATENVNVELCKTVKELKMECKESKQIKENLEKQILEVLEDSTTQKKEIECLREVSANMESEVEILRTEIEGHRIREENLSSELQEKRDEFELWEAEAATFYFDLHISAIREVLLENKVQELTGVCEILEDETAAKSKEIKQMKEKVSFLESENGGVKAQLSAYVPVIASLRDDIASLEHNSPLHTKPSMAGNREEKDEEMAIHLHEESRQVLIEDQSTVIQDGIADLLKLQTRIKAVQRAVVGEKERRATQESIHTNIKVEHVLKETEELGLEGTLHQVKDIRKEEMKLGNDLANDLELQKTKPENGTLMKDIPLDQVSDSSFYARSRRHKGGVDDQMLELWETADRDCSEDPMINETQKQASEDEEKGLYISSELQIEKELGIDKLEVLTSVRQPNQDTSKGKFLERLASDAQKLTSVQTTLQNLKKKMEMNKRSKKANGIEYETVKRRLQEVEEAVSQLVDINDKLTKEVDHSPQSLNGKPLEELEDAGNVSRKRVIEQARNGSEKIGRLQIELQNIEYVLLKLEDEKKSKAKYRFSKSRTGTLLRDFIHSSGTSSARRKKACFCGCARTSTNGD